MRMARSGLHWAGVAGLRMAYDNGRASVTAAVDHHLERIERLNPGLGAFTHVDAYGARAAATESARRFDRKEARPLEGVPVAIKANLAVAGFPTHAGLAARRDKIAASDAAAVARLRAAGAIILGITAMDEGAFGARGDNAHFGRTTNPWGKGLVAGGSSAGSAVAVAAGLCAAALGSDTLGSVRIPASYCGVVGLKPTHGLVPTEGLVPLVSEWDVVGPIARSVTDARMLLDVLAPDRASAVTDAIAEVANLALVDRVEQDSAVRAAHRLSIQLLEGLGVRVISHADRIDPARLRNAAFLEACRSAGSHFAEEREALSDHLRQLLSHASQMPAGNAGIIAESVDEVQASLLAVDALLLPTTPRPAFAYEGEAPVGQGDFVSLASLAGLPAVSLPAGWTSDGLPVGVQLIGRQGEEDRVLNLAERLEAALGAWSPPPGLG